MNIEKIFRHPRKSLCRILGVSEKANFFKDSGPGLVARKYDSYDEYVRHQQSKLEKLQKHNHNFMEENRRALSTRVRMMMGQPDLQRAISGNRTCICLGARSGGEVLGFLEMGIFSVGVDLNPGRDNPLVVYGDFHQLVFPDGACDMVYTNSLDHCMDLDRVIKEIFRILRPGGLALIELELSSASGGKVPGPWESFGYDSMDAILSPFMAAGFHQVANGEIAPRKCFALKRSA